MTQRYYISTTLFNMRAVNIRHLWEASNEYKGQKTQKPNWFGTFIAPKTRAGWWEEPIFAGAMGAFADLCGKSGLQFNMVTEWPIKDGDVPNEPGKGPAEWAKGHWVVGGSSGQGIKVEIVQNGTPVALPNRALVKPGDYCALGVSAAVKQNNPRALKFFLNTVLFTGQGEEIAVGNSVSGAELMQQAQAQGLQVTGFNGSVGGFAPSVQPGPGFAPQGPGGFAPSGPAPAFQPPQSAGPGFLGQPGTPQSPAPGFTQPNPGQHQGFVPTAPAGPGGVMPGAPGQFGAPNAPAGNVTSPFNPGGPTFGPQ
jgi:hypothetical protein